MPLYDFECKGCHTVFEGLCKADEYFAKPCPKCGGSEVKRLVGAPGLIKKNAGTSRIV